MAWVKIENGVIVEKILSAREGYVEVPDTVICGQVQQADGSFANPSPSPLTAIQKIFYLEEQVTSRRIREAVLGIDNGWLKNLNDQIAVLRSNSQNE